MTSIDQPPSSVPISPGINIPIHPVSTSQQPSQDIVESRFIKEEEVLIPLGPGFWIIRAPYKAPKIQVSIGTQMAIVQLANGKFLILDTVRQTPKIQQAIDALTDTGRLIEAVIICHSYHWSALPGFYQAYPCPQYYGPPFVVAKFDRIPWSGSIDDCSVQRRWPELAMRIPAGVEFVNPQPALSNRMGSVLVYHAASRVLYVNDTINVGVDPSFILRAVGAKQRDVYWHFCLKHGGLLPTPESAYQFRDFVAKMIDDWDFDTISAAHCGIMKGNAKAALARLLANTEKAWPKLSEKNKKRKSKPLTNGKPVFDFDVEGCECG